MIPPIDAAALAHHGRGFAELITDGPAAYWVEHRPSRGRSVLMAAGPAGDLIPPPSSVGSQVHEYGGAAVRVDGGTVYFVERSDQRIYRLLPDGQPEPLTPADERRYGDLELDPWRGRLLAVCEDHRDGKRLPDNYLAAVPLAGGEPEVIQFGHDFYLAPRISPDGHTLAWITWDLPNMPWDGTELYVSTMDGDPVRVAGGADESVCHPRWSPGGVLYFISDRSGWWNLYTWDGWWVRPVAPVDAEFGAPTAMGGEPYDVSATHVVAAVRSGGRARLITIDRVDGSVAELPTASWEISQPRFAGDAIVYFGGSSSEPVGVWRYDDSGPHLLRAGVTGDLDLGWLAEPEVLRIPTADGAETHALHYRPAGVTRPPLVVIAHGGPVKAATPAVALGDMALMAAVYWTSRGFAVLDVNYRDSTGYGRPYRKALHGRWGEVDVDDCVAAAQFLIDRGEVDPDRVVLRGWSAGGYTTLMGLARRDFFAAGTAYFPVADLVAVHRATHKYEAGYDHFLIGDWERDQNRYEQRSPTVLVENCRDLIAAALAELGPNAMARLAAGEVDPAVLAGLRVLDPAHTNRTTARESTELLGRIWRDEAGPEDACAEVRRILGRQIWPHRLRSGFPGPVTVSGKTGTLPGIRNEVGVVEYPDGGAYAVAVFTRASTWDDPQPAIDAAIGAAARIAVEHLRGRE